MQNFASDCVKKRNFLRTIAGIDRKFLQKVAQKKEKKMLFCKQMQELIANFLEVPKNRAFRQTIAEIDRVFRHAS